MVWGNVTRKKPLGEIDGFLINLKILEHESHALPQYPEQENRRPQVSQAASEIAKAIVSALPLSSVLLIYYSPILFALGESERRDLNPRPLDPQSSTLAKLRHAPKSKEGL